MKTIILSIFSELIFSLSLIFAVSVRVAWHRSDNQIMIIFWYLGSVWSGLMVHFELGKVVHFNPVLVLVELQILLEIH